VQIQQRRLQPKNENAKFRSASAKADWIKAAFFISAQAVYRQPDLRLKPEAIHKN